MTARERLAALREQWQYDPVVSERIDETQDVMQAYVNARRRHIELSRDRDVDGATVRLADASRTEAHNRAIRMVADLNRYAELAHMEPVGPVCENDELRYLPANRTAVARFAAELLILSDAEMHELQL